MRCKKKTPIQQPPSTPPLFGPMDINDIMMLKRASSNFEKYMREYLTSGSNIGLPAARLSIAEWNKLNQIIAPHNIRMIRARVQDTVCMVFEKIKSEPDSIKNTDAHTQDLISRASRNFNQYMNEFLGDGRYIGLPAGRLSPDEWAELNKFLASSGIKMVPDNRGYMRFTKIQKQQSFIQAANAVRDRAFQEIKRKYPNLSDATIYNIIDNHNELSSGDIYRIIRHTETPYDVSEDEFAHAAAYASQSNDQVETFEYQDWTWARRVNNGMRHPNDEVKWHLSLNVKVTPELIMALDNVLEQDKGQYIYYYKVPKAYCFDEAQYRHDPVTIYMWNRNPEIEQKIVRAIAPFARSNDGLLGEVIGFGVDINRETPTGSQYSVGQMCAQDIKQILNNTMARQ